MNNDAETFDGGAIYLLSFSQLTLYPGAYLDFTNNAGRYLRNYLRIHYNIRIISYCLESQTPNTSVL